MKIYRYLIMFVIILAASVTGTPNLLSQELAKNLPIVRIVGVQSPALGAFFMPVIKEFGLDRANGINIEYVTMDFLAAQTEFVAGRFPLLENASPIILANYRAKGAKVQMLFNTFDYWGTVITSNPAIKQLRDLAGKQLVANTTSTNYQVLVYLLQKEGVDISTIKVISTNNPGLTAYALAGRGDAVHLWEPFFSKIMIDAPGRFHEVPYTQLWTRYTGMKTSPYLGVAGWGDWLKTNPHLAAALYRTYKSAGSILLSRTDEAAAIVEKATGMPTAVTKEMFRSQRNGMHIVPAATVKKEMWKVLETAVETRFLPSLPDPEFIYQGLKE